jgi:hypothetical protein
VRTQQQRLLADLFVATITMLLLTSTMAIQTRHEKLLV